jgi:hypothetical protein
MRRRRRRCPRWSGIRAACASGPICRGDGSRACYMLDGATPLWLGVQLRADESLAPATLLRCCAARCCVSLAAAVSLRLQRCRLLLCLQFSQAAATAWLGQQHLTVARRPF